MLHMTIKKAINLLDDLYAYSRHTWPKRNLINFQSHLRNPTTQVTISEPTRIISVVRMGCGLDHTYNTYPRPIPLSVTNDVTPKVEFQGQETHSKYKRFPAVAQFFKHFSRCWVLRTVG